MLNYIRSYGTILILFHLFQVSFLFAQEEIQVVSDGYQVFYYPDGKISSEGTMRNGKPDGYWKTYNEEGILVSEGNRKNFELDSTWRFYDDEGKITMVINYRNGKKNGIRRIYREDEIIEENFEKDVKEGITRYLYPSGKVRREVNFSSGLEEGLAREFDEEGRIITLITYKGGFITERELINRFDNNDKKHGVWKYFYPNGMVRLEGRYKHGMENGYFKEYDMEGNLLTTSKYADGTKLEDVAELVKLDVRKDYYPDGRIKIAATYNKEGLPEGVRREYAPDGTIESSFIFRNGVLIGEGIVTEKGERNGFWKEYYNDGRLRAEGNYDHDLKDGPWKFYHLNGALEQEGTYMKGKPEGEWRWYYAGGALLREETYYNGLQDGIMTEYDELGNVITSGEFIEGKKEGFWFYRVGDSEVEGSYAAGMRNGLWKHYDLPAGMGRQKTLRFEGRFIEDNPHGTHTYYWDNGKKKDEGNYIMGRKQGDWIHYDYEGFPFIIVSYDNGIEIKYDGVNISDTGSS
ncbi:MAG: toxin-antitoxin system YwqK family antitoxin [Bacteroidales bacterium]